MQQYLSTFSTKKWDELPTNEKEDHSSTSCLVCQIKYQELTQAFPTARKWVLKNSQVANTQVEHEVNTLPTKMARNVWENLVKLLDPACQQLTGMLLATVLQHTPTADVQQKKKQITNKKKTMIDYNLSKPPFNQSFKKGIASCCYEQTIFQKVQCHTSFWSLWNMRWSHQTHTE